MASRYSSYSRELQERFINTELFDRCRLGLRISVSSCFERHFLFEGKDVFSSESQIHTFSKSGQRRSC
jgi:hypothetical protein